MDLFDTVDQYASRHSERYDSSRDLQQVTFVKKAEEWRDRPVCFTAELIGGGYRATATPLEEFVVEEESESETTALLARLNWENIGACFLDYDPELRTVVVTGDYSLTRLKEEQYEDALKSSFDEMIVLLIAYDEALHGDVDGADSSASQNPAS